MINGFPEKQACENCNAFQLVDKQHGVGFCRARSPQAFFVGIQEKPGLKGVAGEPVVVAAFPQVGHDRWCREWGRDLKREPALMKIRDGGYSFHGLRKNLTNDAAESGATSKEIGAITGQSMAIVEHYTRGAEQKRLAKHGMSKLEGRDQ